MVGVEGEHGGCVWLGGWLGGEMVRKGAWRVEGGWKVGTLHRGQRGLRWPFFGQLEGDMCEAQVS